jgi:fatty-acyl-CoA synthase
VNIVGRIKDVVIRGGENVYPTEVEEFLRAHPGLLDVQVIGVPDDRYGEEVMAWVVPRPGAEPPTAAALRDHCAGRLAGYKIPRYVKVVDAFPLTVTGKVRKAEMREQSIRELGLEAASAVTTA